MVIPLVLLGELKLGSVIAQEGIRLDSLEARRKLLMKVLSLPSAKA